MGGLQIQEYIQKAVASGSSIDQIRQNLLSVGWQQSVIEPYLINQTDSAGQIGQSSQTPNRVISNATTHSDSQTIAGPKKPKASAVKKTALGMLGLGVIFIITFIILTAIGKSIYISPQTVFSQNYIREEQNLDLTTADNPYRIFLIVKYTINGIPFGISNKLFDYNFSIADDQNNQIATANGTHEYHKTSSSSDSKTSLSIQVSNSRLPIKDFQIEKNGSYKIVAELAVPESLDSNFTLSDWSYEIKGKVLTPPPLIFISGFILIIASFILFFISKKINPLHKLISKGLV